SSVISRRLLLAASYCREKLFNHWRKRSSSNLRIENPKACAGDSNQNTCSESKPEGPMRAPRLDLGKKVIDSNRTGFLFDRNAGDEHRTLDSIRVLEQCRLFTKCLSHFFTSLEAICRIFSQRLANDGIDAAGQRRINYRRRDSILVNQFIEDSGHVTLERFLAGK